VRAYPKRQQVCNVCAEIGQLRRGVVTIVGLVAFVTLPKSARSRYSSFGEEDHVPTLLIYEQSHRSLSRGGLREVGKA